MKIPCLLYKRSTMEGPDLYCKSDLNHCLPSFDKEKTLVRRGQFFLNKTFISCISFIKNTSSNCTSYSSNQCLDSHCLRCGYLQLVLYICDRKGEGIWETAGDRHDYRKDDAK